MSARTPYAAVVIRVTPNVLDGAKTIRSRHAFLQTIERMRAGCIAHRRSAHDFELESGRVSLNLQPLALSESWKSFYRLQGAGGAEGNLPASRTRRTLSERRRSAACTKFYGNLVDTAINTVAPAAT